MIFSNANFTSFEIDSIQPLLHRIKTKGIYDLTLSMFTSSSKFEDVDSTKLPQFWDQKHSLIFSSTTISVQALMSDIARARLVNALMKNNQRDEWGMYAQGTMQERSTKP